MAVPTNRRAILLAAFIAFGRSIRFIFGYDMGVISGCLIMPDFIDRFGQVDANGTAYLSSSRQSLITSLLSVGTIVGSIAQAFTSDRFGRRGSILIWSAVFTIGTAIQTATNRALAQIIFGRFVSGLGVGALSAIVPLYNGETAPKAFRGALIVVYQVQIFSGIFIADVIELGTHNVPGSASWRIPIGLQIAWGLILLSGIFFLPESPRHLLGTGRETEAVAVVAELNSVPEDEPIAQEIIDELEVAIKAENEGGKATWTECFSTRNLLWKRTINGMMLQFIQQLNGQNFYFYYGDTFFKSAGTQLSPYVIQTILGGVSVAGTLPALYLIDAYGRRRSLLLGALLEATCAIIAGLVGHFLLAPSGTPADQLTTRNRRGGDILIAFAVLHVFTYGLFWGPTPWVYLAESFPLRVRPKCIALGSAANWVWNFLLSFFSPRIAARIGPLILLIFFGMLLFGFVYVYLFIPETVGLSLEEVDELYRSGVKPWNSLGWRPAEKHFNDKVSEEVVDVQQKFHSEQK
ncbi:general substrate transporter [Laetiporus sulphureus 93-53]|uniref:General substrate transporter n=1 Tax=Laetiporus sulphureus 93-53 TaxID=1314785 RepID=A0A165C5F0_9APHY|nr:general substrate transporter [Laetiporus sulphureus 93-53]KZT02237.1 general substrate transporter [Laetiporus sulphureus 93-53]